MNVVELRSFVFLVLLVCFTSCERSAQPKTVGDRDKPLVHTVNYPLLYFTNRLAGNLIDLKFSAPADGDPAFWKPSDDVVSEMQNADLLIMNGATYAKWVEQVSLPTNTRVNTSKAFAANYVTEKGKVSHSHGDGVVHSHDGIAFTTWLDINQAKRQVDAIAVALVKLLPDAKPQIEGNADKLYADLEALDQSLQTAAKKLAGKPLLASHPVYQYLARRYELDVKSVHWEPEVVPDDAALAELSGIVAAGHDAKVMIWEGEPAEESVQKLKTMGIASVIFDPCGNRPDDTELDWLSVMKQNVLNLDSISD